MKVNKIVLALALFTIIGFKSYSQIENTINMCSQYITHPFVSDGQQYKALLNGDEVAEFHATFYGGSTYRIAAGSGETEGNLIFSVYDRERNLLFSSRDHDNSTYWDFEFSSTMDCIIEAELDLKNASSGFAIMLIGFKQQ